MNREKLKELGLTDEQIESVMAEHGKTVNKLKSSKSDDKIAQLEEENKSLKTNIKDFKATIKTLEANGADNEELKKTLDEYKEKLAASEKQRTDQLKKHTITNALKDAGGKDLDYLIFKLGDLELQKDGTIKDLDNLVKDLKEKMPNQFEIESDIPNGATWFDNSLNKGESVNAQDQLGQMFENALG